MEEHASTPASTCGTELGGRSEVADSSTNLGRATEYF